MSRPYISPADLAEATGDHAAIGVVSQSAVLFGIGKREMLIDDVTQIAQRVPYIECAPAHMFDPGLLSELEDISDRLAATVAKLQEKINGKQAA